jgi:Barstar, RNAse (barnase) inhibitor
MEVVLQGDDIRSERDLHRILAEKLDFGPYYGANLAALWDRLTTDVERPVRLIWENAAASRAAMGDTIFTKIIQLFQDVEQQDRDFGRSEAFTFATK